MFRIYYINHDYYAHNEPQTLMEARHVAQKSGFQCRIDDAQGNPVCSYCPISGWRYYLNVAMHLA